MAYTLGRYVVPEKCCMCLGDAELMHEMSSPHGEDGKSGFIDFKVPLCRRCLSKMKRLRAIAALVALTMAVGGGYSFWGTEGEPFTILRGIGTAICMLGIGGLFFIALGAGAPAVHMGDRIVFRNKQYQALFEEANREQPGWSVPAVE